MDAIETHARELLAAEVDRDAVAMPGVEEVAASIRSGGHGSVQFVPTALRAVMAALAVAYKFEASVDAAVEACEVSEPQLDRASFSPPEGFVLVPVEPTDVMLGDGAESRPMLPFTPLEEWEAFEAMSGCEQARHKARLCWAAMLAARPELL